LSRELECGRMDLDDAMDVLGFDNATLALIAQRLEASRRDEHLIYREAELDEVWRLIDLRLADRAHLSDAEIGRLTRLREIVNEAHDLVGVAYQPAAAARKLRHAVENEI